MALLMPVASDVHVNKMLTELLVGYMNAEYIADEIFPVVFVDKQTDIIPAVNKSAFFRDDAIGPLAEASVAADVGYTVTASDTYYCQRYGRRHFISDDRRVNQDAPFNADREGTYLVTNMLMLRREVAWVTDFWKASVWTTDKTGGTDFTKWSDYGSSTPIEDIREWKRTVRRLIGRDPNRMVLGDLTRDVLMDHPDFLDRIKYTERGIATVDLVASLLDLDRILVGTSVRATSAEGVAEASVTYTANWDDDAFLYYAPATPSIFNASAGYTFVWNTGMGNGMQWVRKYRDDERLGDYIEVRSYFDQKKVDANAGLFVSDAVD